jgi:hypothetical protein
MPRSKQPAVNDRDALVATMRTAYRANKMLGIDTSTDTPARIAMYVTDTLLVVLADAITAAGWRPPLTPCDRQCKPCPLCGANLSRAHCAG